MTVNDIKLLGAPRLTRVGLRRGTRYRVAEDGKLSDARVLERDTEVTIGDLGATFNVYERDDGATVFVRVEDELRDGGDEDHA